MADMAMLVDTAVKVPVNLLPLIDDADFKAIEDAIAYNAGGMDIRWNFVTPAGVFTSTAVTPTTGGDYDWTHKGDGIYEIEIPASGGASINNDTEGFGWFSGKATGVLPFRGPVIMFAPANVINSLILGTDKLDINVVEWKGSAAPDNTGDAYARLGAPTGASIAADIATVDGVADAIKAKTDNLPASPATEAKQDTIIGYVDCLPATWVVPAATGDAMTLTADYDAAKTAAQAGNAMALTSGERTTLAAAIEAAIINELDGTAVMQAIADLIASDMTTTDLTVAAIASACRDAILNRVLSGNHDTAGTPGKLLQNCDAPISNVPTVDEFNARTVPAASIATSTQTAAILDAVGVVDTVVDAIKAKTDGLNFTGTDVKATLDGEEVTPTAASKTGYKLASDGLDSVVIETGLNARQALSVIAASAAGVLDGAATEEITMAAAGVPATNRITATVDEHGNRSAVTLSPPT